jgi:hypothetical protein
MVAVFAGRDRGAKASLLHGIPVASNDQEPPVAGPAGRSASTWCSGQTPRASTSTGTLDLAAETPEGRIVIQKQRHRDLLSAAYGEVLDCLREQFSRVNARLDLLSGDITNLKIPVSGLQAEAGHVRIGLAEVNHRLDRVDDSRCGVPGDAARSVPWRPGDPRQQHPRQIGRRHRTRQLQKIQAEPRQHEADDDIDEDALRGDAEQPAEEHLQR